MTNEFHGRGHSVKMGNHHGRGVGAKAKLPLLKSQANLFVRAQDRLVLSILMSYE